MVLPFISSLVVVAASRQIAIGRSSSLSLALFPDTAVMAAGAVVEFEGRNKVGPSAVQTADNCTAVSNPSLS